MLNRWDLSILLRRTVYLVAISLLASGGLITVWLVRPKNASADLVSGVVTGTLAAVICYTVSWGWVAVSIAGVPYGIWLGMASAVMFMGAICVVETLAAGRLLRRHGHVRHAIRPYAELIIPSILAVVFVTSTLFRLASTGLGDRFWHPIVVPSLLLAVCGTALEWPWWIRALLHGAWIISVCAFAALRFVHSVHFRALFVLGLTAEPVF